MEQRRPVYTSEATARPGAVSGASLDADAVKVLRNTYMLLAMTVAFSAITAVVSMAVGVPYMGLWMFLPYIGMLFAVEKTKDSGWALFWPFALTGFMGLTLGPILNFYLAVNGSETIILALGACHGPKYLKT